MMRDPADDLAELDALLGELKSGDGVPDEEAKRARCHALLAGLAGEVDPTRLVEEVKVLEALDELSDVARAAHDVLVNFPHWATECRLADAIKVADELGIEVEPYRRLALEMTRANMRDSISEILVAIRHGECPPSEDWHWIEYESTMERMRDHGVDVSRLEAALERARYIESCWARGVAPDMEDDEDDEEDEDEEDEEADEDEEDKESDYVIVDSPVVRGDQTEERAPPESSSRPRDRGGGGAAGRALVEIHLRRLAALETGDGGATLRDIVWALLALDDRGCVRLEGQQQILIDHLCDQKVLARSPSERAARAALRRFAALSPLSERRSRREWVYHLDMLRAPSDAFVARLMALAEDG